MKIVFVSKECPPSQRSSGIGSYVWETGRALAGVGHPVTIIAASDNGRLSSTTPSTGITVIRLPDDEFDIENRSIVARTLRAPFDQGLAYRRRVAECLATIIRQQHPDVVEFPGFRGESVMWLTQPRVLPLVVRMHGFTAGIDAVWKDHVSASRRLRARWERQEVKAADVITVVSEQQASLVRARFGSDRVQVVHNSIDVDQWRNLSSEASQEIGRNDLLFAGSLVRKKGIFVLLRAASLLRKTGWRGRLVLAGRKSSEFERFIRLRSAFGIKLPDWVTLLGICKRERLAGLYRDAGACCLPSLREPFPYTCLEAMACGGVVIGTLGTGMAEMLDDTCGFLVSPGDVLGLAAALTSVLAMGDPERTQIKGAARQRVKDRFDNSVIIPRLLDVYHETSDSYRTRC